MINAWNDLVDRLKPPDPSEHRSEHIRSMIGEHVTGTINRLKGDISEAQRNQIRQAIAEELEIAIQKPLSRQEIMKFWWKRILQIGPPSIFISALAYLIMALIF